jgi:hypothetical protein
VHRLNLPFEDSLTTDSQLNLSRLYLSTDSVGNPVYCYTKTVSVGTCFFAKALPRDGCVFLLFKNLLPSNECCFVVGFEVVAQ